HDGLNGVRNQITRLEGKTHPVRSHGNAVAYTYRVESETNQTGGANAFPHFFGESKQMHVAGIAFIPNAGNSDLRLIQILVREARRIKHRLRSALRFRSGDC